jgi:hypothetical protein
VRKLISILFITLFLLNVLGYYGLFIGLHYQNSRLVNQQLDSENYNDEETLTIKMPITIPYATDSRDFERVTGEFEYHGEFYRLVKQRLTRDTLHIVCVKDSQSKRIHQALATYVKTFSDKPVDGQQNTSKSTTDFIKDYLAHTLSCAPKSLGWECEIHRRPGISFLVSDFYASIVHPPERA